ncbi:MAG: glycerol-3-phosphate acyltransferase PlsX, partial [Psychromonas sp.]
MSKLTIAIDAMGGDVGPHIPILAALKALQLHPNLDVIIVGNRTQLLPFFKKKQLLEHPRLNLIHTDNEISMEVNPVYALRHTSDSSMHIALKLVSQGKADACVSAGNTGALMLLAKQALKTLPGISRPALISSLPNMHLGHTYMLDLGANLQCDSHTLFNFAVMGSVLCEKVDQINSPRVSILNVGQENNKGGDVIQRCAELLKHSKHINYAG